MTDALSAIARDDQRANAFAAYISALADLASARDPAAIAEALARARAAALGADSISGGYFGGQSRLQRIIERDADVVRGRDPHAWSRILVLAWNMDRPAYDRLLAVPPLRRQGHADRRLRPHACADLRRPGPQGA